MGVKKRIHLRMPLRGTTEEWKDRWVVRSDDFGVFVYGATEQEALAAFDRAMSVLLESFRGDEEALRQWLDHMGVEYTLSVSLVFEADKRTEPVAPQNGLEDAEPFRDDLLQKNPAALPSRNGAPFEKEFEKDLAAA